MYLFIYEKTCLTNRVTHQNDINCLGNIIKFEKKMEKILFLPLEVILRSTNAKFSICLLVHGPESVTMHPHYSPTPTLF